MGQICLEKYSNIVQIYDIYLFIYMIYDIYFSVDFSFCCIIKHLVDSLENKTMVAEDKLSPSQQLDFIKSEGEVKGLQVIWDL